MIAISQIVKESRHFIQIAVEHQGVSMEDADIFEDHGFTFINGEIRAGVTLATFKKSAVCDRAWLDVWVEK